MPLQVEYAKIIGTATLWILSVVVGLIPYLIGRMIRNYSSNKSVLGLAMCFSGGVLMATCFLHMIPEIFESDANLTSHDDHDKTDGEHDHGVPPLSLALCGGFFLVYLLDETFNKYLTSKHMQVSNEEHCCDHNVLENPLGRRAPEEKTIESDEKRVNYGAISTGNNNSNNSQMPGPGRNQNCNIEEASTEAPSPHTHNLDSVFKCVIIIFALSFHSIFDGFAIGLQSTNSQVLIMTIGIGIHKLLVSLVIGIDLFAHTQEFLLIFLHLLVFSLMTPLGVIISLASSIKIGSNLSNILTSVSTGSLLYVTFFEILDRRRYEMSGLLQFLATSVGFGFFALTQLASSMLSGHT